MTKLNPKVDNYLAIGCGRCPLVNTPACKVHTWTDEMVLLRQLLLDSGLTEEVKWSMPCYTSEKRNIVLMSAFKEYCALSFFKGALLKDTQGILIQQTEHVQSTRQIRFTNVGEIVEMEPILKAYIAEAIEIERAGLKVAHKETSDFSIPDEFQQKLDRDPELKAAFEALTPGRQRGYIFYFSQPKRSQTRTSRIEKYTPEILAGKGFYNR